MRNYGHDLQFGAFITPRNDSAAEVVRLAQLAEEVGLDLVTFQDHPYQRRFLDAWTLIAYVAARTSRIQLSANVHNLQLRQPAVLARAVASLDILTGGRIELGIGAGAFPDAVAQMGAEPLTGGRAVQALEEAIDVIRALWDVGRGDRASSDGAFHRLRYAARGPAPVHEAAIWVGAQRPRALELIGRKADGWLPSLPVVGIEGLAAGNAIIDEAARAAGRDPSQVRRLLNVTGELGPDDLTRLALEHGVSTFILMADEPDAIRRLAGEVGPAVREQVAAGRALGV